MVPHSNATRSVCPNKHLTLIDALKAGFLPAFFMASLPRLTRPFASKSAIMPRPALIVRLALWLWFAAAIAGGYYLLLQRLNPLALPVIIGGLAALALYLYFRLPGLRDWLDDISPLTLVQLHLSRFFGAYFLFLFYRGDLPYAFAVPAGIGELIVAVLALGLIAIPRDPARQRHYLTRWNLIGLIDIILVTVSAARIYAAHPPQLRALTHLPLSLLPLFLFPLLIATHVMIFARLLRR